MTMLSRRQFLSAASSAAASVSLLGSQRSVVLGDDTGSPAQNASRVQPKAEVEEEVYRFEPADNGSGPMWCHGNSCLVRLGGEVFASGLETLKDYRPLNNCRWTLYRRGKDGWQFQQADQKDRTREPCPLGCYRNGRLFMSVNPNIAPDPNAYAGPARPEVLQFPASDTKGPYKTLLPAWSEPHRFSEHSYRSFAADGVNGELVLFQNISYTHSCWAFLDRQGKWTTGKLVWLPRKDPSNRLTVRQVRV